MKLICLICLAFVMMISLSSCNVLPPEEQPQTSSEHTEPVETESPYHTYEELMELLELDPDKQNLPSYEELSKIQYGTTLTEVYSIAGNPQRMEMRMVPHYITATGTSSAASPSQCYIYDSADGGSILVHYRSLMDEESDVLRDFEADYIKPSSIFEN